MVHKFLYYYLDKEMCGIRSDVMETLIREAQQALASNDQERIIQTIRHIMLTVPDEMTDKAISLFLGR